MMRIEMKIVAAITVAVLGLSMARSVMAGPRDLKPVKEEELKQITEAIPDKPTVKPKRSMPLIGSRAKRKILVIYLCEGFYHGSIPAVNKFLEIMGKKTGAFSIEISQDMSVFTPEKLAEFDAIVFNNTTRLKFKNEDQKKALMDFVKGGKGIIGIHGASDNFGDFPEAAAMMGGLFDGHPWGGGGTWGVKLDEPDHPINKGFNGKNFKIKDEIYQIKGPYSRDTHRVLLSLDLEDEATAKTAKGGKRADKDFAISWIKRCGEGRVFYCSLGHNNSVFFSKGVAQHYLDGIQYALGDYDVDDTPSNKK